MSRLSKILALVVVVVAGAFASGCKSSSGCSSCGAKAVLPAPALDVKAEGVSQA